jgi:ketosteroid isomerase-like protein
VQGKENIRKGWQQMLLVALPGPGLGFSAAEVEVARSGDLAWEHGTYAFATTDKKGKTTTEKGKCVTGWKKQPDGAWKVVADIDNANE